MINISTIKTEDMEDFLVPSLEDLEENPLIRDSFIGVSDPVLKWPLGVEFVEADGSASSDVIESVYHPSQQQQLSFVQSSQSFGGRQRQESFNFGQLLAIPDPVQQQLPLPFPQQKTLPINIDGGSQFQQQRFVEISTSSNGSSFESWLEDKTDLALLGGWIGDSATIDYPENASQTQRPVPVVPIVVEGGVAEKDQILQEIVRECEEIERRSSPGSDFSSSVSSPSSVTSRSNSTAPSTPFSWTARPVTSFTFKRQQASTITLEQASTTSPPKGVKARSKSLQKEKKKAQNREAATRYREKKRREREGTRGEMQELESRNHELRTQVEDAEYEIQYLRNLMREIGLAK